MRKPHALARKLAVALFASGLTVAAFACGSRSGLIADGPWDPDEEDASVDDPVRRLDARVRDVQDPLPGLDARPDVIVDQRDCKDPSETVIYVLSDAGELYAFDPRDFGSRLVGPILCPAEDPLATPFSMAVDRQGVAYVVFNDGELFRVSTRTAACAATAFAPNQQGVITFGMGFASDTGGPAETLFVSPSSEPGEVFSSGLLGTIGLPGFDLNLAGLVSPEIQAAELTGTGDGRLFAFYTYNEGQDTFIGQLDKDTAALVGEIPVPGVSMNGGWAFAFWGGDFFTFTGIREQGLSNVTRIRPSDGTVARVATIPANIVGAGVSTCSPVE